MKGKNLFLSTLLVCSFCLAAKGQFIYTFAGTGVIGFSDGGGIPDSAQFNHPWGLARDRAGNLYISDYVNSSIRKISSAGVVSTFAGTTTNDFGGDGGPATAAMMRRPTSIALDAAGNLYIADEQDNRIRKVDLSDTITTIAGTGVRSYTGDGGAATAATLNTPTGIAIDPSGNIYIADSGNNVIRKIDASGIITTFAGTGAPSYTGDGGPAISATFWGPIGVTLDGAGNLFVADHINNVVRKISPSLVVTTFAGNGVAGFGGDYGPATAAQFYQPNTILFDAAGNAYITDEQNNRLRMINAEGVVYTIAGNGSVGYSGDGGPAINAQLFRPMGLAIDSNQNVYIADFINSVIRRVNIQKTYSGILANQSKADMTVYPVPADNIIHVALNTILSENLQLEVQNMLGQKLSRISIKDREATIDLSTLVPGCYYVICYHEGTQISHAKFIKN